ncbi:MAG: hypothetical protein OXB84_01640 [Halobacteriovoraceae bacterium]|nr:hypothetical protein [Halobacteriovoraceae bacterium]
MKKTLMIFLCLVTLQILAGCSKECCHRDSGERKAKKMKRFEKYDVNNDGKLSKEEWMAKFSRMDADQDGFVSFEEKMKKCRKKDKEHKEHKEH